MEQSAKELGQAFAGAPTNIDDGSMVFFNPAAMSQTHSRLVSVVGHAVFPPLDFENNASQPDPILGGARLRGGNNHGSLPVTLIPSVYYVQPLNDQFVLGLAINTPFGMRNHYQSEWPGRYQAINSELMAINVNPGFSLKLTDKFSFGAGLNVQYLETKLTNAVDFGTICLQMLNLGSCAAQDLLPQLADGHVALKGSSVGVGYNLGIFYALSQNTHLGVSYRSSVKHRVHGKARYSVPDNASILTQNNVFVDTKIRSTITLPDSVLFGFSHRFNPQWAVAGDIMWTRWSHMQELRVGFLSMQPDSALDLKWRDTWRYAVGVSYTPPDSRWVFRSGFAYDQTPIPNAQLRPARIPDNDRYWVTAGVSYALPHNIRLHGAYAYLFVPTAAIDSKGATADHLMGKFSSHYHIVGVQLDWRF